MHPVIMRQLAADRIGEMHAKAENERQTRQARRARRRAPSAQPTSPASGTPGPRSSPGRSPAAGHARAAQRAATAAMAGVRRQMAATPSHDAKRWTIATDQSEAAGGLTRSASPPLPGTHAATSRMPIAASVLPRLPGVARSQPLASARPGWPNGYSGSSGGQHQLPGQRAIVLVGRDVAGSRHDVKSSPAPSPPASGGECPGRAAAGA